MDDDLTREVHTTASVLAADEANPSPSPGGPLTPAAPVRPGQALGRYLVLQLLGSGGLGDVFAAWDPELDRRVALKVLKQEATRRVDMHRLHERLVREARAMARLTHPNVVAVHDVGIADNRVFIAMEFVPGLTLQAWSDQERRTWQETRRMLADVGRGLLAAHEAGLVHRDLKPTNVIVSEDGRARVLDFGLARKRTAGPDPSDAASGAGDRDSTDSVSGRMAPDDELTRAGTVLGTPAYMAPEQFYSKTVDSRADQFSYCVTAFEAFYGQRPFLGTGQALIDAVTHGELTMPDDDRGVPVWLRKTLLRGLSLREEDRYSSMRELLDALHQDKRSKRRWIASIAGSAVLSGIAGAMLFAWLQPPPPSTDSAVDALVMQANAAAARNRFVYPPADDHDAPTAYTSVLDLEHIEGEAEELADEAAEGLRHDYAAALVELGDRYWDQEGGAPFAADYYAQALLFAPDDVRALDRIVMTPGELATLRSKAAEGSFSDRDLDAAEVLAAFSETDEATRKQKVARAFRRPTKGRPVTTSAHVEDLLGEPVDAVAKVDAAPPTATPDDPVVLDDPDDVHEPAEASASVPKTGNRDARAAAALVERGRAALGRGQWTPAARLFHQALEQDPRRAAALIGLSDVHFDRGEYAKAVDFASRAVRLEGSNASYRLKLGDAYLKLNRYPDARTHYAKAKRLGHRAAAGRLEKLDAMTGR